MLHINDDSLLEPLGADGAPNKARVYTALQERLIAGFEDILRFTETHGRAPFNGEIRDFVERLYAVRLDHLRVINEARDLLKLTLTRYSGTRWSLTTLKVAPSTCCQADPTIRTWRNTESVPTRLV